MGCKQSTEWLENVLQSGPEKDLLYKLPNARTGYIYNILIGCPIVLIKCKANRRPMPRQNVNNPGVRRYTIGELNCELAWNEDN